MEGALVSGFRQQHVGGPPYVIPAGDQVLVAVALICQVLAVVLVDIIQVRLQQHGSAHSKAFHLKYLWPCEKTITCSVARQQKAMLMGPRMQGCDEQHHSQVPTRSPVALYIQPAAHTMSSR